MNDATHHGPMYPIRPMVSAVRPRVLLETRLVFETMVSIRGNSVPFHFIVLFQAMRPIYRSQTIQTVDMKKTEENRKCTERTIKNTENTKHTVKQPRQQMNVHAHSHNLKRLYQSITSYYSHSSVPCRIS